MVFLHSPAERRTRAFLRTHNCRGGHRRPEYSCIARSAAQRLNSRCDPSGALQIAARSFLPEIHRPRDRHGPGSHSDRRTSFPSFAAVQQACCCSPLRLTAAARTALDEWLADPGDGRGCSGVIDIFLTTNHFIFRRR